MAPLYPQRMTAELDGDFVVFVIGMRINRLWKVHKWWPVFSAMPRMLRELAAHPESGFLGAIRGFPTIVQYWRSFDHLERYARDHDREHWPAWVDFNRRVRVASGDVGIWHETFLVDRAESMYVSTKPMGLAAATTLVPVTGRHDRARARFADGRTAASAPN